MEPSSTLGICDVKGCCPNYPGETGYIVCANCGRILIDRRTELRSACKKSREHENRKQTFIIPLKKQGNLPCKTSHKCVITKLIPCRYMDQPRTDAIVECVQCGWSMRENTYHLLDNASFSVALDAYTKADKDGERTRKQVIDQLHNEYDLLLEAYHKL